MKRLLLILFVICSVNVFSQDLYACNNQHLTHFGNYNPPDDPAIDTGWLIVGFFLHLNGGGGIILSGYGIGVFYDTRRMGTDFENRIREHRRIIHKKHIR